ncbi:MAG: CBS domain-containing protein [Clostridiales bacterium]|nr:CBS domain-containing protein [Clostridiales bacterium]MCF8023464.1 CBS domain-containing protein [Clostridiales bacterium]
MEKKAKHLMSSLEKYPRVNLQDDMHQAVKVLSFYNNEKNTANAAVVEDKNIPVGLITVRGILEAMEPKSFNISQWSVPVFWDGLLTEQISNLKNVSVGDIFIPNDMNNVDVEHNLMRVVYSFNKTKMPAVAVIDGQNMVGIIEVSITYSEIINNIKDELDINTNCVSNQR